MAATSGFPKWLLDGKQDISRSQEWEEFVEELYDAVQQQLKESHVGAFTDLTAPERQLFMERAAKAIHGGSNYGSMYDKVSEAMDKHLNNEVNRQLLEELPINTKTDLVLDAAQEGIVSLLKKWPDMKAKLHVLFNQPLPQSIRQLAWKLYLENTKVRKKYVDILAHKPRSAISKLDFEISQKCEQLLMSEQTFADLKGSVGAFYGMKALLSYHHATQKAESYLPDTDFLLTVPFVMVAAPSFSRREPASSHVVALLVEEYFTFLHSRPGFMVDSGSEEHDKLLLTFCKKVAQNLQRKSPETATIITNIFVPEKEDDWNDYKTAKNEAPREDRPRTSNDNVTPLPEVSPTNGSQNWSPEAPDNQEMDHTTPQDELPKTPNTPQNDPPIKTPQNDQQKSPANDRGKTATAEPDQIENQNDAPSNENDNTKSDESPKPATDKNSPQSPKPATDKNSPQTPNANETSKDDDWEQSNNPDPQNKPAKDNSNNNNNYNSNNNNNDKILTTDAATQAMLSEVLLDVIRPVIRSMFVGYVNMDVVLFLWDQYVIGLDAPGFHDEYLPAVVAILFILLKEHLKQCNTPHAMESVLRNEGVKLKVPQFQYEIKKHFGLDLMRLLNQDDRAALPVLDPTQANYRPWVYWFSDNVPARMTPQERHLARAEREAERERQRQLKDEEARRKKEEEERRRFENEQEMLNRLAQDKRNQDSERAHLEDALQEERRLRLAAERDAQREIELLKLELQALRGARPKSNTSVQSLDSTISRYLIPPPPSVASHQVALSPIVEPAPTPRVSSPPHRQADDILLNLLKRAAAGFNNVGHGTSEERAKLDRDTRKHISDHKEDVKAAESRALSRRRSSQQGLSNKRRFSKAKPGRS